MLPGIPGHREARATAIPVIDWLTKWATLHEKRLLPSSVGSHLEGPSQRPGLLWSLSPERHRHQLLVPLASFSGPCQRAAFPFEGMLPRYDSPIRTLLWAPEQ